jgi:hypothetical protein
MIGYPSVGGWCIRSQRGGQLLDLDSGVVVTPPAPRGVFIRKPFEHDLLVRRHGDVVVGGDRVGTDERGAELRRMQMPADGPVALAGSV